MGLVVVDKSLGILIDIDKSVVICEVSCGLIRGHIWMLVMSLLMNHS